MAPLSPPFARRAPAACALVLGLALVLPVQAQDGGMPAAADAIDAGTGPVAATPAGPAQAGPAPGAEGGPGEAGDPPATDEPAAAAADTPASAEPDFSRDADGTQEPVDAASPLADDAPAPPGEATAAEDDFEALYGAADDDGAPARPAAYDPWERYNRRMHRFNNAVDRRVARPLASAYVRAVPAPVRSGVSNFFNNLGQPVSAINALLQGKPRQAAHSLGRFVLNSTLGIGGVFDPATAAKLENRSEDFGQTLGVWGWKRSRYVELPLFGPRTLRDVLGMAGDAPLSPLRQVDADRVRVPLQGMQLVDLRAQLLSTDALREGVEDDYALVRDAWSQRRDYQIRGDRDDSLPDYLREDPTVVPVDAMPVPINN